MNDKILKLEKQIVNRYSRPFAKIAMVFAVIMPPYVLYWKQQQMDVRFIEIF